ncbi:MAG: winged helix-turn-helix domain-containing protein [Candidatus Bathyarchaeota archaeon]|nr:winged helix-turn-helix domain-containing protein [Candidatus Bathyarchaeota archaeon]
MSYHPNAYIPLMVNKRPGLEKRTKILNVLAKGETSLKSLQKEVEVKTSTLKYHLKLLEKYKIVEKKRIKGGVVVRELRTGQRTIKEYF